jgi:ribosomal protein S18 acetylase RimI-like enzyme
MQSSSTGPVGLRFNENERTLIGKLHTEWLGELPGPHSWCASAPVSLWLGDCGVGHADQGNKVRSAVIGKSLASGPVQPARQEGVSMSQRSNEQVEKDKVTLVRATPDLADAIRDLTLRAYIKWVSVTPRKPRPMTADYDEAMRKHQFDCLWSGDVMVGLIETLPQGDELMIVNVAVDPEWQGQGPGVKLMRHAEVLAIETGLRGARLYTNKLMVANVAFYTALGYRYEKETHHDLGTVAIHMTKSLVAPS